MNPKKTLGIVLLVAGVVLFFSSVYIKGKVLAGQEELSSGKEKVGTINKLFSISPQTNQIGQRITQSANRKIAEGEDEVLYYTQVAKMLKIGGIVALIAGGVFIYLGINRKR